MRKEIDQPCTPSREFEINLGLLPPILGLSAAELRGDWLTEARESSTRGCTDKIYPRSTQTLEKEREGRFGQLPIPGPN